MQQPPTTSTPLSGGSFGNLGGSHGFGSASGIGRGAPTYTLNTSTLNAGPSPLGSTNVAGSTSGSNGSHSAKVLSNLLGTSGPVSTGHSGAAAGAGTSIGNTAGLTQADMSSLHYLLSSPAPPTSGSMSGVSSVLHSGSQQLHTNLGASALQALGAAYNKNGSATNNGGGAGTGQARGPGTEEDIYTLVLELFNPTAREQALSELSKKRDQFEDLALVLWNSYGIMAIILQEIIMVYPLLHSSALSVQASNRVCNALALLQLVAAHPETRQHLIHANIPQFLYPFLSTTSKSKPYDNLRLTSLGVIGAIVKNDNPEVIHFFLQTEFLPLCLKIMEIGSELCKVVATFIFHKILSDDGGLMFMTDHPHRFYIVQLVLSNMIDQLVDSTSPRLLKIIVRCYLRLADDPRAREELRQHLPEPLHNATFFTVADDPTIKRYFAQLLLKLSDNVGPGN